VAYVEVVAAAAKAAPPVVSFENAGTLLGLDAVVNRRHRPDGSPRLGLGGVVLVAVAAQAVHAVLAVASFDPASRLGADRARSPHLELFAHAAPPLGL
jgi:hypothetical protein